MTRLSYRSVFVSDVHLGYASCRADYLLDFLRSLRCERLYLVGDIVDLENMQAGDILVIDVRPEQDRAIAPFAGADVLTPDSHARLTALPKDTALAFICHHGNSSRNAAEHFREHGFTNLWNVEGGIDAWSSEIDPSIPRY